MYLCNKRSWFVYSCYHQNHARVSISLVWSSSIIILLRFRSRFVIFKTKSISICPKMLCHELENDIEMFSKLFHTAFLPKYQTKLSCQKKKMHFKIWHEIIDNKLDRLILTILFWSRTKQPSSNNQHHPTSVSFVKICYNQQHRYANYFCTFVLLLWPIGTQFIVSKGIFNGYSFKQEMIILFCFLWNDNKF